MEAINGCEERARKKIDVCSERVRSRANGLLSERLARRKKLWTRTATIFIGSILRFRYREYDIIKKCDGVVEVEYSCRYGNRIERSIK